LLTNFQDDEQLRERFLQRVLSESSPKTFDKMKVRVKNDPLQEYKRNVSEKKFKICYKMSVGKSSFTKRGFYDRVDDIILRLSFSSYGLGSASRSKRTEIREPTGRNL